MYFLLIVSHHRGFFEPVKELYSSSLHKIRPCTPLGGSQHPPKALLFGMFKKSYWLFRKMEMLNSHPWYKQFTVYINKRYKIMFSTEAVKKRVPFFPPFFDIVEKIENSALVLCKKIFSVLCTQNLCQFHSAVQLVWGIKHSRWQTYYCWVFCVSLCVCLEGVLGGWGGGGVFKQHDRAQ